MSRRGPAEGVVRIGHGRDAGEVLVSGRKALSRAIHGDVVAGDLRVPLLCVRNGAGQLREPGRRLDFATIIMMSRSINLSVLCSAIAAQELLASIKCCRDRGGCPGGFCRRHGSG